MEENKNIFQTNSEDSARIALKHILAFNVFDKYDHHQNVSSWRSSWLKLFSFQWFLMQRSLIMAELTWLIFC